MKTSIKYFAKILLVFITLAVSSCDLDVVNPNGPTDAVILSSRDGLITLSVGLRQVYSTSALEALVVTPGTTARELRGITTFTNIIEVDQGGDQLPTFNGNILAIWSRLYRVMTMTDDILANASSVLASDAAMLSGVEAHAKLFKAMVLGGISQSFTHAALATNKSGEATFVTRAEALTEALRLLQEAEQTLTTTPPSTEFNTRVTGTDFNLLNTIRAYRARYSLMNGQYANAISAAQSVDLTIASSFIFTNLAVNPIYNQLRVANNYAPRDNFGLPPELVEAADGRIAFYLTPATTTFAGDPTDIIAGFSTSLTSAWPVYLPDEMRLIIAEAIVRSNGTLTDAVTQIDAVRTQASGDPFGVHANLPAYSGAVTANDLLTEIYKQRCAELYLSGLRLEDSRRFGRTEPPAATTPVPLTFERSRNFYPFPQQERQNNSNTPADPAI